MQADDIEKEEHLMCVICEFEDSYLIYKILLRYGESVFTKETAHELMVPV